MTGLIGDLRHAFVVYRKTPLTSAIAIVTLSIALAFVSAFLSLWSDLALKAPEGFESAGRLVTIGQSGGYAAADSSTPLTPDIVEGINATVSSLEYVAGIASFGQVLSLDQNQHSVMAEAVTQHFSDLRPRLQLGRSFESHEHTRDSAPVVMLSHRLWQELFAGSNAVLGETLRITEEGRALPPQIRPPPGVRLPEARGQDYRVVGVMSSRMRGTFADDIDIWLPYEQAVPFLYGDPDSRPSFDLGQGVISTTGGATVPTRMRGLAQLRSGVSAEAAGNELNARLEIEGQALTQGLDLRGAAIRFDLIDGVIRDIATQRETKRQLLLFVVGTLLLAIVAACNISLFLLARATHRQREFGIRMAVGASMNRLARQLASEAGLMLLIATALSVFIALWLSVALSELPFLRQAEWRDVSPFDWRVLGMLAVLIVLLSFLVSLAPVLGLRRMGISASSGIVTARPGVGQRLAGTVQIALTGAVGAVAVAFAWQLVFYSTADRGFDAEDVLVVELEQDARTILPISDQAGLVVERQRRRDAIAALPGVDNVSLATSAPGGAGTVMYTIVQRESGGYVEVGTVRADEYYIDLLDMRLSYGTNFDPGNPLQILVNEGYANEYYASPADAVGDVRGDRPIVGVLADISFGHPAEPILPMGITTWPQAYYPIALVRTKLSPAALRGLLQERIDSGELEIAFGEIHRLSDLAARDLGPDRARMALTGISALVVVVLSAIGFYGTQRYLVTTGRREFAILSAIGAGPQKLGRLVIARSYRMALPGLVFAAMLAFLAAAWLRDGYVTAAISPGVVAALVMFVIVVLVLTATLGPAHQARRLPPASMLNDG